MKNIWIIANWKANKTLEQALEWLSIVGLQVQRKEDLKVVVCPTFTAIEEVKKEIDAKGYPLLIGAQDLSPFDNGSYTGEETAGILKQFVTVAILGHSERRENFGETDETVAQKVNQAIEYGITPLVCVQGTDTPVPPNCQLVAFEPVFAIGTGNSATPKDANEVAEKLKARYGADLEVIYGGSVNSDNIPGFIDQENISMKTKQGTTLQITGRNFIEVNFEAFGDDSEIIAYKDKSEYDIKNGRLTKNFRTENSL